VQEEVNQEESEQNEVDRMKKGLIAQVKLCIPKRAVVMRKIQMVELG